MDRVEQIKHTLEHEDEYWYYRYPEDIPFLLQRVEELEKENGKLDFQKERLLDMVKDLEAEIQRLSEQLERKSQHLAEVRRGGMW